MARDAVLVTGISGNLGRGLARLLHKTDRVIGVDRREFAGAPKDLEVHNLDIRKRKIEDLFRRGDLQAMIHMAIVHDPRLSQEEHHSFNVLGTKAVLEYAAKYGVRKVVVLSSASVYGPLAGFDPMVQLIHEEDVARALALSLRPGLRGVYNVCGPGELPLSAVLRELGRAHIPIPHLFARPLLDKLFQYRLAGFPSAELDHLQFLCTVDGSRYEREAGFRATYTLRETIRSVLGEVPSRIHVVPEGSQGAA